MRQHLLFTLTEGRDEELAKLAPRDGWLGLRADKVIEECKARMKKVTKGVNNGTPHFVAIRALERVSVQSIPALLYRKRFQASADIRTERKTLRLLSIGDLLRRFLEGRAVAVVSMAIAESVSIAFGTPVIWMHTLQGEKEAWLVSSFVGCDV